MDYDKIKSVIEEYRQLLIDEEKQLGMVNDIKMLPTDKDTLKAYLLIAIMNSNKTEEIEFYKMANMPLAEFQTNVGFNSPNSVRILENIQNKLDDYTESESKDTQYYIMKEIVDKIEESMKIYREYEKTINIEQEKLLLELSLLENIFDSS